MDRAELYDQLATRKQTPKDFLPYKGDNGRVNKCAQLIRQKKLRNGGRLLDVGGGIGDLCDSVRLLYDEVVCADISSINLSAAASKGIRAIKMDVDTQGIRGIDDGTCDLVTALDFIEHIVDPEYFAEECFRALKPGGEVFINTPNIRYWQHVSCLLYSGNFPHTSGDREVYHGGHLAFFTFKDLCDIFGKAGFNQFTQFMDEEGYCDPTGFMSDHQVRAQSQQEYRQLCMEFGCPNLLFKAVKP